MRAGAGRRRTRASLAAAIAILVTAAVGAPGSTTATTTIADGGAAAHARSGVVGAPNPTTLIDIELDPVPVDEFGSSSYKFADDPLGTPDFLEPFATIDASSRPPKR